MKEKNPTWNRLNRMRSTSYADNKRQKSFWQPPIKKSIKEETFEEKSNDEPEQMEFNF